MNSFVRPVTQVFGLLLVVMLAVLGLAALALAGAEAPAVEAGKKPTIRSVQGEGGRYWEVDPPALAAMLMKKDFPLVNVHVPYEGEIPGTDLFFPFDQVEANLAKLPPDKGARVVLYCLSGPMSGVAARTLVRLGYTDVWDLAGGMIAWQEAGHPLLDVGR